MKRVVTLTLAAAILGLVGVAGTAAPLCACSTFEPAYRGRMFHELLEFVASNETFFADSGRYAAPDELLQLGRFSVSDNRVEFTEFARTATGFTARVAMPNYTEAVCWITYPVHPSTDSPRQSCTPKPNDFNATLAVVFAVLLSLALVARVFRSIEGTRTFTPTFAAKLGLVALVHPFWPIPQSSWCGDQWPDLLRFVWLLGTVWFVLRPAMFDDDDPVSKSPPTPHASS